MDMSYGWPHKIRSPYNQIDPDEVREVYEPGDSIKFSEFDCTAYNRLYCIDCEEVLARNGRVDDRVYVCIADLPWCESRFRNDEGYEVVAADV